MEIETEAYVTTRERAPDNPAMDRALKAEALAADAIRLLIANMSIVDSLLALTEHRNPAFVETLRAELGLMRARVDDIGATMRAESENAGG